MSMHAWDSTDGAIATSPYIPNKDVMLQNLNSLLIHYVARSGRVVDEGAMHTICKLSDDHNT